MQAPGILNITIYQGASWDLTLTWKTGEPPVAVNLTGYTARMHIRRRLHAPDITVALTTSNGRIALGGAAGTIALALTAADTTPLCSGKYVYDLELVNAAGYVTRLIQGHCHISGEVTR
jgi:hypothetical protein